MSDRLRNLLGQLADDQPVVHDWPARVRQTVLVRRRQRQRIGAVAAAAVLVFAGTGIAVLASAPAGQDALIGSASPSPTASLSAGPSTEPSAQPSAVTTTVAATPAATPAPPPSVQEPEPEPAPSRTPALTYPQRGSQDIEISARTQPERPVAGQEWVLEVIVTGFAEREPDLQQPCIEGEMCQYATPGCPAPPEGQSPPPARPQRVERTFRHTFPEPGRYDVRLQADSGCSYYFGRDELLIVVEVGEAPPKS